MYALYFLSSATAIHVTALHAPNARLSNFVVWFSMSIFDMIVITDEGRNPETEWLRSYLVWSKNVYIITKNMYSTALWLSSSLSARQIWSSIPGPVKSDTVSPTGHHCCDVSSKLCRPGAKPRRWIPEFVTRFGVIPRVWWRIGYKWLHDIPVFAHETVWFLENTWWRCRTNSFLGEKFSNSWHEKYARLFAHECVASNRHIATNKMLDWMRTEHMLHTILVKPFYYFIFPFFVSNVYFI